MTPSPESHPLSDAVMERSGGPSDEEIIAYLEEQERLLYERALEEYWDWYYGPWDFGGTVPENEVSSSHGRNPEK